MQFKKIIGLILAVVALLFIVQNLAIVEIQFLFWSFSLPRALFLLMILAIGMLMGWLLHSYLAHRHEQE